MADDTHAHPWYFGVFVWLFILTALEVGVTYINLSQLSLSLILTALAFLKAAFVAIYFMHLKFEKTRLILFVSTPFFAVILLLIYISLDALHIVPY